MSEESKSNAPDAPAPLGEIEHGPSKFEQFMEKNLKKLILLALLIVIGVAAFVITNQLADAKDREAGNALLAAESPDDYRKVSKDYPGSGAAASAQLLLAGQLWDEGKKKEAMETFKTLAGNTNGPAAAQAQFSLAGLQLKEGNAGEAKSNYESILSDSEAKYLHPFALVALGDIAAAAGDEEKAREYYQRKLDDFTEYADQNIAVTRLNLVGVDQPEKVPPPPAPEPSANPNAGIPSSFTTPLPNPNAAPAIQVQPAEPAIKIQPPGNETVPAEQEEPVKTAEETPPAAEPTPPTPEGATPTFEIPAAEEEN